MTTTAITPKPPTISSESIEKVLIAGDLSKLSPDQRLSYYKAVCESVGLNPLTKPFEYLQLSGKLTLYARRDATDQLRKIHGVSIEKLEKERIEDVFVVTAYAKDRDGRTDSSTGAVTTGNLKGDALANALMKAETKAKRRVTLSICGLGMMDETEIETVRDAVIPDLNDAIEISGIVKSQEEDKNSQGREYYRFTIGDKQVCAWFDSTVVPRLIDQKSKQVVLKVKGDGSRPYELVEVVSVSKPEKASQTKAEAPEADPKPTLKGDPLAQPTPASLKDEKSPILDAKRLAPNETAVEFRILKTKDMTTRITKSRPKPSPYLIVEGKTMGGHDATMFCYDDKLFEAARSATGKVCYVSFFSKADGENTLLYLRGFIEIDGIKVDKYGHPVLNSEGITEEDIEGLFEEGK